MPESTASLRELQQRFTAHVRNPGAVDVPEGIESRRMKIYDDLIYKNIEGFLSGGFPVLRSLYRDEDWQLLVRDFIVSYRCSSPFFLEISQEFLNYLMQVRSPAPVDPPYMLELAHYEWVELALDVATDVIDDDMADPAADLISGVPVLSPLVMSLRYQYPVHLVGPGHQPEEPPPQPTYLLVYRNRQDVVRFMESNAATARLLELVADNPEQLTGQSLLEQLAGEMNADSVTPVVEFGARTLSELKQLDIIVGARPVT